LPGEAASRRFAIYIKSSDFNINYSELIIKIGNIRQELQKNERMILKAIAR